MAVRVGFEDDGGGAAGADGAGAGAAHDSGADYGAGHDAGADADSGAGGESLFEPLLVTLFLQRNVVRGAGFKDKPVLAQGIINGLTSLDPEELDYRQAVALLDEASRLASAAEALKAKAVARVCATAGDRVDEEEYLPPAGPDADRLASMTAESEIRTVLDSSNRATDQLILHSSLLTTGLPATLDALSEGKLKPEQAQVIVDQCGTLPEEAYAGFEEQLVAFAPGRARHLVAAKARRLREKNHPETIKRRKEKAAADRTVIVEPVEDGMCWLSLYLPAEAAVAAFNRLTQLARSLQCPDEDRTLVQLRADVAADLLHSGTGTGHAPAALSGTANDVFYGTNPPAGVPTGPANPGTAGTADTGGDHGTTGATGVTGTAGGTREAGTARYTEETGTAGSAGGGGPGGDVPGSGRIPNYAGIKAEVFVVVPVLTLMGLSDEPADLEGYGPVDEDTARQLAANAPSFRRLLTHPETGALLSFGRGRYGVPKDLQTMVRLRDRTCRGYGCNRSARSCEIDHSLPYPRGKTEDGNLKPMCKPDHILKTAKLWRDIHHRDGRVDWTSPAGRKYSNQPEGPLPETRPVPDITDLLERAKHQAKPRQMPGKQVTEGRHVSSGKRISKGKPASKSPDGGNADSATTRAAPRDPWALPNTKNQGKKTDDAGRAETTTNHDDPAPF